MSIPTPTDKELEFARQVFSGRPVYPDGDIHYLVGMIRSLLGMTENAFDRTPEEMVRLCRAAILAYDESRR